MSNETRVKITTEEKETDVVAFVEDVISELEINIDQFSGNDEIDVNVSEFQGMLDINQHYDKLTDKPKINGVELVGNKTTEELKIIYKGTVEYWNSKRDLVSEDGALYIYTNYKTVDNGDGTTTIYPALKIGDGSSYLIDMPFVTASDSEELNNHIQDNTVHITNEEREFWNNKWSGYMNREDPENLYFTTNRVVLGGNLYA